ncbi:hypothetical protein GCM10023187_32360 [Nibrella viscosa]|uniref:Pirin n=1 Tax=Nibrella viscosa TaxID=1084524 RepID=A0ABP8KKF3_9BACT
MNRHTQIYLADQRGCSETDSFRSYHTFNFGVYQHESRRPFGPLHLLNDDLLRAGAGLKLEVGQNTIVLLLPVLGGLEYRSDIASGFLEAGQLGVLSLPAGTSYTIHNPYETEYIQCIQCWIASPAREFTPGFSRNCFDLSRKNTLVPLWQSAYSETPGRCFIGRYDGRQEGSFHIPADRSGSGIFVFNLQGVFEVANCLLHQNDGLALWVESPDELAFEALANESLLLVIELPPTATDKAVITTEQASKPFCRHRHPAPEQPGVAVWPLHPKYRSGHDGQHLYAAGQN